MQPKEMKALLDRFQAYLRQEERAEATVEKYMRDVRGFLTQLTTGEPVTKDAVLRYKQTLSAQYKATSTNSMLVALNQFFAFWNRKDCQVKLLRVQRTPFREREKELTREEYARLVRAAQRKKSKRLALLLQTICSTGIRVSEHRYITCEALAAGRVRIVNKGKERSVFLPKALCKKLLEYCKQQQIRQGPVFITRNGKAVNRCNIWAEMKALCKQAGVGAQKLFPHNLRHLFAMTYYKMEKDIVRLADILGHATIETTRIYTYTSREEHVRTLSRLRLLI